MQITRLRIPILAVILLLAILLPRISEGKVYIDIDSPAGKKLPVAIKDFIILSTTENNQSTAEFARKDVLETLKGDLEFSGLFDIIEKEAYIEDPSKGISKRDTDFSDWRVIGAEALIKGAIKVVGDSLTIEMRLYDTIKEKQITGTRYIGKIINPRVIAHRFADEIVKELTGQPGIFSTRFLFVAERTGNKEIYMSDYDGKNVKQLSHNGSINLSPRWSPNGKEVLFTSYLNGNPTLYRRKITTGRTTTVSNKEGINIGGRWAPNGKQVVLTLSIDKNPELYLLDLMRKKYTRVTKNHGIDVSADFSPDGKRMVYVSDIAGNPHIYMIDSQGGIPKRLTYEGRYNTTPVWSPNGKRIAFTRLTKGNFNIWSMKPDGSDSRQLTFTGNNEDPAWSPDSRYIIFTSSKNNGISALYIMRYDGTGTRKVDIGLDTVKSPSWSPFLRY